MSLMNLKSYLTTKGKSLGNAVKTQIFLTIALALGITALSYYLKFPSLEAPLLDSRIVLKGKENLSTNIALVSTNNPSANPLENPTTIRQHLAVFKKILEQKPRAVAFLNHFDPSDIQSNWDVAKEFVDVAQDAIANGVNVYFGTDIDLTGEVLPPYPLSQLPHHPAVLHKDGTMFALDKVVRRALLTVPEEPSLHLILAYPELNSAELTAKVKDVRGAYFYEPAGAWHTIIRYPADTSLSENNYKMETYQSILISNETKYANKIVLIDSVYQDSLGSFIKTPYSKKLYHNPKLFVHAAILDTILKNDGIIKIPAELEAIITLFLTCFLIIVTVRLSPSQGVFFLILISLTIFCSSFLIFKFAGLWLRLVNPLFAIFCTYYLVVPYRARIEYKKRWKVQQQHDILKQVEEMKGNFLSLMSHDLKTPVARIQGLAEMVLRQGGLSEQQKNETNQIIETTESLNRFISKILDLTKIESSKIKLKKKSKDINKLINQCIDKLSIVAQRKNIKIEKNLEPLFPVHVDASLIIQVLNNLIDNAIKYSPENATVKVSSLEENDTIKIIVEDNGQGLNELEIDQLFTKFYRGKNPASTSIKGSGLGLYLSKYFIELHNGTIKAENNNKSSGSKFVVALPI